MYHMSAQTCDKQTRLRGRGRTSDEGVLITTYKSEHSNLDSLISLSQRTPTTVFRRIHSTVLMAVQGVQVLSNVAPKAQAKILTDDALKFLAALHRSFESTRQSLLKARESVQKQLDSGGKLDFPPETADIRAERSWVCAPPAPGLEDRRVEITGPTDRKMVVNALNSGAKTFMADFEGMSLQFTFFEFTLISLSTPFPDATSPTFANLITGQVNLYDAVRRQIDFEAGGKQYKLSPKPAVLIVRYASFPPRRPCTYAATSQPSRVASRRAQGDRRQHPYFWLHL